MRFSEYYEKRQKFEDLEVLDESLLTAIPKFIGGAATNIGSQALRGAGNIAGGAARSVVAPDWKSFTKGLGQTSKGAAQILGSPLSAVIRGTQAAMEPLSPSSFLPGRTWFQKTFGLNALTPVPKQVDDLIKAHDSAPLNERNKILKKMGTLYIRLLREMMPGSKELEDLIKSYESILPQDTSLIKKTVRKMADIYIKKTDPEKYDKSKKEDTWKILVQKYKQIPKDQLEARAFILRELEKLDPERYHQTIRLSKQKREEEQRKGFFSKLATT